MTTVSKKFNRAYVISFSIFLEIVDLSTTSGYRHFFYLYFTENIVKRKIENNQ